MKFRTVMWMTAVSLFAALAISVPLSAQTITTFYVDVNGVGRTTPIDQVNVSPVTQLDEDRQPVPPADASSFGSSNAIGRTESSIYGLSLRDNQRKPAREDSP